MAEIHQNELTAITPHFCEVAESLHQKCFDFYWKKEEFLSVLSLPTTQGFINQKGLIVYSLVFDEAEILTLCTDPHYQKQGVATQFIQEMICSCQKQNVHRILLEVRANNIPAIKLYEKQGFQKIGIRKNYYRTKEGPVDALCYELTLT